MRDKLKTYLDKFVEVVGTFKRYGTKRSYNGTPITTVLLVDIHTLEGEYLTDHQWFVNIHGFDKLGQLRYGDKIAFNAKCEGYAKGEQYREFGHPREWDYELLYPSNIRKI